MLAVAIELCENKKFNKLEKQMDKYQYIFRKEISARRIVLKENTVVHLSISTLDVTLIVSTILVFGVHLVIGV